MGIPNFLSRIRDYGVTERIGSTAASSQSQINPTIAIIDGPSLAHYLCEQLIRDTSADLEVECFYNYDILGKRAVGWLNNLSNFGFEIEGIYFDGALPASKRDTRLERLQKAADNLSRYRNSRGRYAEQIPLFVPCDLTLAYCFKSAKKQERETQAAVRKLLPPPPFLVAAVIEALMASEYRDDTWVVDGEADAICAAEAHMHSVISSREGYETPISIFTNDSDLIIWRTGAKGCNPHPRIVMLSSIKERYVEGACILEALSFSAQDMLRRFGQEKDDLLRPAFKMLDPKITFRQAVEDSNNDNSEHLFRFLAQYIVKYPALKIELQKDQNKDVRKSLPTDPRVSELVRHYLLAFKYDLKPGLQSLVDREGLMDDYDLGVTFDDKDTRLAVEREQDPISPFGFKHPDGRKRTHKSLDNHNSRSLPPMHLEMFLPALFEDPQEATAWRVGVPFRNAAEMLLMLPFDEYDTTVFEYRRSGTNIIPRRVEKTTIEDLDNNMTAYLDYFCKALQTGDQSYPSRCWRFLIMQLTMSDLNMDGKAQPSLSEILAVFNSKRIAAWSTVHLFARYQAQYYSLRMLNQVMAFCLTRKEFKRLGLPKSLLDFSALLHALPPIWLFFRHDYSDVSEEEWQILSDEFAKLMAETADEEDGIENTR